jgi:hypothetical protein
MEAPKRRMAPPDQERATRKPPHESSQDSALDAHEESTNGQAPNFHPNIPVFREIGKTRNPGIENMPGNGTQSPPEARTSANPEQPKEAPARPQKPHVTLASWFELSRPLRDRLAAKPKPRFKGGNRGR